MIEGDDAAGFCGNTPEHAVAGRPSVGYLTCPSGWIPRTRTGQLGIESRRLYMCAECATAYTTRVYRTVMNGVMSTWVWHGNPPIDLRRLLEQ